MKIILMQLFPSQPTISQTKSKFVPTIIFYQRKIVKRNHLIRNSCLYNNEKDSKICYFLVFIAKSAYPTIAVLTKAAAIETCQMFSNGTLPYERSHVNTLNAENLTYGLLPSETPRAPILAWFGATLDYEKREYVSDINRKVIKTDDQELFNSNFWLYMNVGGPSMGSMFTRREMDNERNVSGECLSRS